MVLCTQGIITDDGAFVFGNDGILTEEEMSQTLKVRASL